MICMGGFLAAMMALPGNAQSQPVNPQEFLAAINQVRSRVKPAAKPALPKLVWDPTLATMAQKYVDQCPQKANQNRVAEYGKSAPVGENWSFSSQPTPAEMVVFWEKAGSNYDYATN